MKSDAILVGVARTIEDAARELLESVWLLDANDIVIPWGKIANNHPTLVQLNKQPAKEVYFIVYTDTI